MLQHGQYFSGSMMQHLSHLSHSCSCLAGYWLRFRCAAFALSFSSLCSPCFSSAVSLRVAVVMNGILQRLKIAAEIATIATSAISAVLFAHQTPVLGRTRNDEPETHTARDERHLWAGPVPPTLGQLAGKGPRLAADSRGPSTQTTKHAIPD